MQWKKVATFLAVVLTTTALAWPATSQYRDDDGTRMQARQVEVGSEHTGRLDPPQETADWRMIKLEDDRSIHLELVVETDGPSATLTLTSSTGGELDSATAGDDPAKIETDLDAGIYYFAVESGERLGYTLRIE